MSKNKIDITKEVMSKIERGQLKMRPKWMFVVGSVALVLGVIGTYVLSVFLVSLISFSLRTHGPMGAIRYQQLLDNFPLWAVGLAIVGTVTGIVLLKRFEFSYKNNFVLIVLVFIVAVLISGWLADYLGFDKVWVKQGQMRRLYQQYDGRGKVLPWRSGDDIYNFRRGNGQDRGSVYTK